MFNRLHQSTTNFLRTCFGMLTTTIIGLSAAAIADQPQAASTVGSAGRAQQANVELPETVFFNAHIRPIMSNTCFTCHGPDEEENSSGLRLDSFEVATEQAIVPGDASASQVFQRISDSTDPMPPADFRHQLSDYEKALIEKWIDQGAQYQPHWSWAPLVRPEIPPIAIVTPGDVPKDQPSPIDRFIQSRLATAGLQPTRVADRRTLLRRLSLDLIGLPPTPAQLAAFEQDTSDDAWQTQVERLLASPHYGERMATQWLDIVRFSDTVGFHGDQNQNNFAYRDYVIEALNNNKPFDEFTIEQLAGDLLENPDQQQLIATGLVRLNMMTREGGAQPDEYLAKYTADRVRMLGTAWLGATTGCCECHNHKYDPFTARDFYSLGAYFDDLRQWGVYTTYKYTPNPDLQGFTNEYPFPPELRFKSQSLEQQILFLESRLETETAAVTKQFNDRQLQDWLTKNQQWLERHKDGWKTLHIGPQIDTNHPDSISGIKKGQRVDVVGPAIKGQTFTVTSQLPVGSNKDPLAIRTLRLSVIPDEANKGYVGRSGDGRFRVSLSAQVIRVGEAEMPTPVEVEFTLADRDAPIKYVSGRPPLFVGDIWQSGPANWQLPRDEARSTHTAWYRLKQPLILEDEDKLIITLKSADIGKFELAVSPLARFSVGKSMYSNNLQQALLRLSADQPLEPSDKRAILSAWYWATTPAGQYAQQLTKIRDQIIAARSGYALTTIAQTIPDQQIKTARVLRRGNWQDQSGAEVLPATPAFLPGHIAFEEQKKQPRQTRLDLARWLVAKQNPLVARHYVNRTWKHFFGKGLSNKLDDLGNQGEWPSHPELLDWLAAEFRDNWDMKNLVRLIVHSHTYRQAAAVRSDLKDIDPYNRLLSQQSARRLEAEAVRDNALAIAGLLETRLIGGPSVFPYQPDGHYGNLQFPNRTYTASHGPFQYRRGVYMHWQRTFLHPMLVNFDAPARDECVADRTESNSPQQALTLLNDPSFVEAARAMAVRIQPVNTNEDFGAILDRGFQLAVGRSANAAERAGLQKVYSDQVARYRTHTDEATRLNENGNLKTNTPESQEARAQLAAWTQVCRVILNLHETITRF